jgi:hypothetical protein
MTTLSLAKGGGGAGRDQSEPHDNPKVGEGWCVVEKKGLDGK